MQRTMRTTLLLHHHLHVCHKKFYDKYPVGIYMYPIQGRYQIMINAYACNNHHLVSYIRVTVL